MRDRVVRLTTLGLVLGAILMVIPFVTALVTGSPALPSRSDDTIGVVRLIPLYIVGGGAAGLLVAVLQPLARWTIGSIAVGIVALVPITLGIAYSVSSGPDFVSAAVTAVLLGGTLGPAYREISRASESEEPKKRERKPSSRVSGNPDG